jgi:hypothetical protein
MEVNGGEQTNQRNSYHQYHFDSRHLPAPLSAYAIKLLTRFLARSSHTPGGNML